MSYPNGGGSGAAVGTGGTDQMGLNFPGGGNDEWKTETYRNKGTGFNLYQNHS